MSGARGAGGPDDDAYLRRIVGGAASLAERLGPGFEPVAGPASLGLARERTARWRAKLAPSGQDAFERRLAWLETTPDEVAPRLGEVRFAGPLPGWASWLGRALDAAGAASPGRDRSIPFADLVAPFVAEAGRALSPALAPLFAPAAFDALLRGLAAELGRIAEPVFHLGFCVARGAAGSAASTAVHDAYVERMLRGGLRTCFADYPVLARLLATTLGDFVDNGLALAAALAADADEIARRFEGGRTAGRVAALRTSLSDRHDGGRTVSLLTFESGLNLVYKPRDIAVERAWFELLAGLNGAGDDFGVLRVLARPGRGWVEFARPAPCAEPGDVARFYRRAGMLLAVLYALEASDCFFENIVARGAWPLLIDMEALMHPSVWARPDLSPAEAAADDVVFNSVFRAGFLPTWERGPAGECVDISGLGAAPGQVTSYATRVWSDVGTDAMDVARGSLSIEARDHLPTLDGAPARAADHVEAIVDGFAQSYRGLAADGLGDLPQRFAGAEIRFIAHPTRLYGLLLKRLGAPRHMRDGAERSIEMDVLSRVWLEARGRDVAAPLLAAEIAALDRLDVPKFTVGAGSRSLALPTGAVLHGFFSETAVERAERRVRSLDEADLARQVGFIRTALSLSTAVAGHAPEAASDDGEAEDAADLGPAELIEEARAIGADLLARAIASPDGSVTWIAPQVMPGADRYELRPLRLDLYSGSAGLALFFAALHRVTGSDRGPALAALAPLRHYLRAADPARMARDGYTLGAATGVGAFLATLAWCGDWLGEPSLHGEAIDLCARVTPDWIAADAVCDVVGGSAGAILGLLCLHHRRPDPGVLARAVACGHHLAGRAVSVEGGAAWPAPGGGAPLTGFSHGAAGVAAALHRLGAAADEPRFTALADRAVAWEDATFDAREGNWPDFRRDGAAGVPQFMCSWCHGAPGIGLGRAAGLRAARRPALRTGCDAALGATVRHGIGPRDGLCCGALGRADLLLALGTADTLRRSRDWAAQVVRRKRRRGAYRLTEGSGAELFDPSFFQGLSGIGYQLLRTAAPGRLPSVLSWE